MYFNSNVTYICFDYLFEGKNTQEQKNPQQTNKHAYHKNKLILRVQ